jgi:hypothetical protein
MDTPNIEKTIEISIDDFISKAQNSKKMSVGFGIPGIESGYQFDKVTIEEQSEGRFIIFEASDLDVFFKLYLEMPDAKYQVIHEDDKYAEISVEVTKAPFMTLAIFLGF